MAKIISLINQKGGVGKTTSSYNIGYILSKSSPTLLVDLDPQASLTIYAGLEPYSYERTMVDVLAERRPDVKSCIVSLRDGLDIIPSRIELAKAEIDLLSRTAREQVLSKALDQVSDDYGYIVIDCPPQLSTLTYNALASTDAVLIPCKTDYLSYRGIPQLLETIDSVREDLRHEITVLGVLATMFESRAKDDQEILEVLRSEYDVVAIIKRTVQAKRGMYDGQSVAEYAPGTEIAQEYEKIVEVIKKRI